MRRKNLIVTIGIIGLFFLSGCAQLDNDVYFAKSVFHGLCSGNQRVQNSIDWETLTAVGINIGEGYTPIKSESERADYRKAFFWNFALSFKSAGGRVSQFFNWRIKSQDADNTIVAADTAGQAKVILFTITHKDGKRKLTAISWE